MTTTTPEVAPPPPRNLALPRAIEPIWKSSLYGALALSIVIAYFLYLSYFTFFNPAHPGVDQNGYLVGGKMMADHRTTGFSPSDVYQFVGRMWVSASSNQYLPDTPTFYPKYPIGLPAIYALLLKIGGARHGQMLCFAVSPVAMSAAIGFTYLLIRAVLGSFAGLLGMIIVASSQVTLALLNNPNSHATSLLCVTAGMFLLIRWWQCNGLWRAILAGLLLGYAVTIRYTEGLLILPMMLVALFNLRWRDRRSWRDIIFLGLSWLIPVILLVSFNLYYIGTVTGYDPCNESTGFRWEYFQENWDTMLRHLSNAGLFFIFPFSIFGLIGMFRWHWKLASVLLAWVLPVLTLYTAYYWAPDGIWIGYVRFYLSILPALTLAALWTMLLAAGVIEKGRVIHWRSIAIGAGVGLLLGIFLGALAGYSVDQQNLANKITSAMEYSSTLQFMACAAPIGLAAGLIGMTYPLAYVIAISAGIGVFTALPMIEKETQDAQVFHQNGRIITGKVPAGSAVFGEERLFNYLQFAGDYKLYTVDIFNRNSLQRLQNVKLDEPNGLQPQRAKDLWERVKNKTDRDLITEQNKLMSDTLKQGRRVFFIFPKKSITEIVRRLVPPKQMDTRVVAAWNEVHDPREPQPRDVRRPRGPMGMANFRPQRGAGQDISWQIVEVILRPAGK